MFKHNIDYIRSSKLSPLGNGYQRNQGYQNIDSPMKAAFRQEAQSPKYNLSPMKINRDTNRMNRSRSPILLSKRDDNNSIFGNKKLSPFRRMDSRQTNFNNQERGSVFYNNEQNFDQSIQNNPKNMSFTNLIRKSSNTCNSPHNYPLISPIEHSTSNVNYLQSDRNFRQDTNLFKKLATMLESNKSNQNNNKSFVNSAISQNSIKNRTLPQSCKNATSNLGSGKKVMFRNVITIESIQSPQDYRNEGKKYQDTVETKCYSQYEKMTAQYPLMEKKQSNRKEEPKMDKKFSQKANEIKDDEVLFKKVSLGNEQIAKQVVDLKPIDFHLTNSFGTAALKNKMETENKKQAINPFDEIVSEIKAPQGYESQNSITQSLPKAAHDSMFASLQMLLQKASQKQQHNESIHLNESINLSILSQNSVGELDMEPYIDRR